MKTYDFLFLYEVKNRELENICLLKYELESRGYSVGIINTWQYLYKKKPEYSTKVLVVFALYNNATYNFLKSYVTNFEKVINLQWEQVISHSNEENRSSAYFYSGVAKKCVHIAWGERNFKRLTEFCSIPERNVKVCGHISADFLRPEFQGYYMDKKELLQKYSLDSSKKIYLFISSFSLSDVTEDDLKNTLGSYKGFQNLKQISIISQRKVLAWLNKTLEEKSDIYFIYRPHPAELKHNELLNRLQRKHKNFLVIGDYTVKQWIINADKIYTWFSTSLFEIAMAGKSCDIIRPIDIPYELDMELFKNARIIKKYKEFSKSISNKYEEFPVDKELMNSMYDYNPETPSYKKIVNVMVEVLDNDYYDICYSKNTIKQNTMAYNLGYSLLTNRYVTKVLRLLLGKSKIYKKSDFMEKIIFHSDMISNNSTSDEEINIIMNRIRNVLEKY